MSNINLKFVEHFAQYKENYVVIGGTAASILVDKYSAYNFRITND
jgi:hypothetical protein